MVDNPPLTLGVLVKALELLKLEFNPKVDVIYYPGCAYDVSPSRAFPQSRVIYVDIDPSAHQALRQHGLEAYCDDANSFEIKGGSDIVILLNQVVNAQKPVSNLRKGGFVICNDYHSAATQVKKMPDYIFLGAIRYDSISKKFIVDKDSLDDFWKIVETDEEFKEASFSFAAQIYSEALRVVRAVTGQEVDIVKNCTRIYQSAMQEIKGISPNWSISIAPLNVGGESFLLTNLPKKKGSVDDLFIFRK